MDKPDGGGCSDCEEKDPIQKDEGFVGPGSAGSVHAHARDGLRSASQPLPHGDRIQKSFGHHDISHIKTNVGGDADVAGRRMGARAFASGSRIGFRGQPSQRLAAHEAAHVVQQRRGVSLKDDVGEPGDAYEQQADEVAEQVQSGGSAEEILDNSPGEGDSTSAVQKECDCGGTCPKCSGEGQEEQEDEGPVQMELQVNAVRVFDDEAADKGAAEAKADAEPDKGEEDKEAEGEKEEEPTDSNDKDDVDPIAEVDADQEEESAESEDATREDLKKALDGRTTEILDSEPNEPGQTPSTGDEPANRGGSPSESSAESPTPSRRDDQSRPVQAEFDTEGTDGDAVQMAGCQPACYNFPSDQPAQEPDQQPENPPGGEVDSEADDSAEEDLDDIDNCPADESNVPSPDGEPAGMSTLEATSATAAGGAGGGGGTADATTAAAGGGGGGPAAASEGSGLGEVITSAEAQREISVAAFADSSSSLANTGSSVSLLRGGIQFASTPGESAALREQRSAAASRASSFFAEVADQLDEAIAYASTDIPDQLSASAEAAKAEIEASMQVQKSEISAKILEARAQARANAAMARSAVHAQAAAYTADVEAAAASAIESLTTAHADTMGEVNALETATLDSLNSIYFDGRAEMQQLGETKGNECQATARRFAAKYRSYAVNKCTKNGFWDGDLAERRAYAQADAATSLGDTYYEKMTKAADKRAKEVTRNGRKQDRCAVIAAARRSRDTLDQQLPNLISAIEATRDNAIEQGQGTETSLISSIDSSLSATLASLDAQESSQRQAVNDTGYMQQVLQEQVAHGAASAVQQGVQTAVTSVHQAMTQVQGMFSGAQAPPPAILDKAVSSVEQRVTAAMESLHASAFGGASTAESQLADTLQQALTALSEITASNAEMADSSSNAFSESMGTIAGTDNFETLRTTVTDQISSASEAGSNALMQAFEGFQQTCTEKTEGATSQLEEARTGLEQNLDSSKENFECEITTKADQAASREPPAWKNIVAGLLIALVVIIVIAVTVITAGAAGPVIVAALGGPLLAGVIIGGVVGAVVSGLITVATNLMNNRSASEGVLKAMAIGLVTGAAGGFIGAAAGAGAGALFAGASKGVQLAAQFGAAMISAGGMDVLTQWVMGGFSFENFSVSNLITTLAITMATFGLASAVSARTAAAGVPHSTDAPDGVPPPTDAPDTVPTSTDAPDTVPTSGDAPDAAPTSTETPDAAPTSTETPDATPTATEAPDATPAPTEPDAVGPVDTPESAHPTEVSELPASVDAPEPAGTPKRRGTVTADSEGVVEHPVSTPEVEVIPARRGGARPKDTGTPPPDAPDAPDAPEAPRRSTTEEIRESLAEDTTTIPETDQGEHFIHGDDVRGQANPRTSKSTTRAEREAGAARGERDRAARRSSLDEESGSHAPEERPSDIFDDPFAPEPTGESRHRPSLREETKAEIEAPYARDADGRLIDPETGVAFERPTYGHKPGYENRRTVAAAEELGLTQEQLSEYVNARPEHLQIEEYVPNVSHENEVPGIEGGAYDEILLDMQNFFNL